MRDLEKLQRNGDIPSNVQCSYNDKLRHDFVVVPEMVALVREYCIESIHEAIQRDSMVVPRARL